MAFNGIGPFYLARSAESVQYAIWFDGDFQTDRGAQYIMAHPETDLFWFPQGGSAAFSVGNFIKTRTYNGSTGEWYYTYNVNVANVGQIDTWFSLQGGGCV